MRKRRKVLVILGLIAVAAACFVMLHPRDEPKYQGRYLSEWMEVHLAATIRLDSGAYNPAPTAFADLKEAERAVQAIGTNALPYFIKWIKDGAPDSSRALFNKFPSWISDNRTVKDWFLKPVARRFHYGLFGIQILGSNATSAIPELNAMMRNHTKPNTAVWAIQTLRYIGEPAIPVLKTALADTNQIRRWEIVLTFKWLVKDGHTNACLPILMQSLNDENASVREAARYAVEDIAPQLLTNAPAY